MNRYLPPLLTLMLLTLSGCVPTNGDGNGVVDVDIATLMAYPQLYYDRPLRLHGQLLLRDDVQSPYLNDTQVGNTLQYCPMTTVVLDDGTGALQFSIDEFTLPEEYDAFVTPLLGKTVDMIAVWPDYSGMSMCLAVCVCDPKLVVKTSGDISVVP